MHFTGDIYLWYVILVQLTVGLILVCFKHRLKLGNLKNLTQLIYLLESSGYMMGLLYLFHIPHCSYFWRGMIKLSLISSVNQIKSNNFMCPNSAIII